VNKKKKKQIKTHHLNRISYMIDLINNLKNIWINYALLHLDIELLPLFYRVDQNLNYLNK